jgi:hypothetical protein
MDSGWAVVLGAGIALLGTAFVPWLKDAFDRRVRLNDEHNRALTEAIREVIECAIEWTLLPKHNSVPMRRTIGAREYRAVAWLELLLNKRERPILNLILDAMSDIRTIHTDPISAEISIAALMTQLGDWHRGMTTASEAHDRFENARIRMISDEADGFTPPPPDLETQIQRP